jgi:ribosomal protein S18 acetylase RimI-like enzyme
VQDDVRSCIRAARRSDLHQIVDLRMRYLGEAAHLDARLRLLADARARTEQWLPVWMGQEERILLIAEDRAVRRPDGASEGESDHAPPAGYAMGVLHTWPPLLQSQHVGEIAECYVVPEARGRGFGRALVQVLSEALRGRGAQVLRAALPVANQDALARLRAAGYVPLQRVMERRLDTP